MRCVVCSISLNLIEIGSSFELGIRSYFPKLEIIVFLRIKSSYETFPLLNAAILGIRA